MINGWLCGTANKGIGGPREMVGPGKSWLPLEDVRYVTLCWHCERNIFIRGKERSVLLGKPLNQGC
jgi:hypothetical protein